MEKKVLFNLFLAFGLIVLITAVPVFAVTVTNPIRYNNFCSLITQGIIPAVAGIIGALATLMIVYSGFLFITSAGSPEKIKNAKTALTYAIIGMIVAGAASAIAAVIKSALGVTGDC